MSIQKLSNAQTFKNNLHTNFKAQTSINAPKDALSKEDRAFLTELGSNIGTDKDTINITVGEKKENVKSDIVLYNIKLESIFNGVKCKKDIDLPISCDGKTCERYRPEVYLPKMVERVAFDYDHNKYSD